MSSKACLVYARAPFPPPVLVSLIALLSAGSFLAEPPAGALLLWHLEEERCLKPPPSAHRADIFFCSIARHKKDPTAKYCQLGTAAIGGGASVRTWVFRGFYEDKGALKFITDRRSQKIPEIAADPGACVGGRRAFA